MNIKYRLTALFTAVVMLLSVCLAAVAEDVDDSITKQEYDENLDTAVDSFFELLMTATTIDAFDAISNQLNDEQYYAFFAMLDAAQIEALNEKFVALIEADEMLRQAMLDEGLLDDTTFISEILYRTVPYTRVAAFKAPVVGTSTSKARTMAVSSASYALTPRATSTDDDNGLELSKSVVQNADGSYTLTLEAYATGEKVITEVKKDVPTDIVLVLDQSGSMADDMNTYDFRAYTGKKNSDYYALRQNGGSGNLYYLLDDGGYASVSVTVQAGGDYTLLSDQTNQAYHNSTNLYVYVDGEYYQLSVTRSGKSGNRTYTYSYVDASGVSKTIDTSSGNNTVPTVNTIIYQFQADVTKNTYTYSCTDANGEVLTIGTSTAASTQPKEFTLYERYVEKTDSRLNALKSAVTTFVNSVNAKAAGEDGELGTADDINHRIAIVGFGSESGYGNNTELLSISGTNSGSVGVKYGDIETQDYKDVLQNMDTSAGQTMVNNAINALAAEGATRSDLGMTMAVNVLAANPIGDTEKRNRVVIMFTDGVPTTYTDFSDTVADNAVDSANTCKNTYGATVYAVGIFDGADATSAGSENGTDTQKANRFMQRLSSNNGKPQTPSYYLSAADASDLNSIFKQIANNIESGGSTSTLDETAVVRDIIAPSFTLPEGTTTSSLNLYTEEYTSTGFTNRQPFATDKVSITTDENDVKSIDVSGFDFSKNWVGTETAVNGEVSYRGKKLIIEIPIVVREGFLGGNNVPTNGDNSGVYSGTTCIENFEMPHVNVPIAPITVEAPDKNVYLLGGLTQAGLLADTSVTCNGQTIDLSQADKNYGLEDWKTAYVTITPSFSTQDNKDLTGLTDDLTYTVGCTIAPSKTAASDSVGTAAETKSDTDSANINVFKPVLTYADSVVEYLSTHSFPTYFEDTNYRGLVWKHGDTLSTSEGVKMTDTAPDLTKEYSYDETDDIDTAGKIIATADIPVDVTVKIVDTDVTSHVTFGHQCDCVLDQLCGWNKASGAEFLLHVKDIVADLTITKKGLDEYAYPGTDDQEMAIFTVTVETKDGQKMYTIALADDQSATIKDVLVGTDYTIAEQNGWTWRYQNLTDTKGTIVVGGTNVTITNNATNPYWLGGDNYAVNVFGTTSTGEAGND